MTLDKNNNIIEIGDIVKIENHPIKIANGLYVVEQDGTSNLYSGNGLTMLKVCKSKSGYTLSTAKYHICFYPFCNFSNKYKYTKDEMRQGTIEIVKKCNPNKYKIIKNDNLVEQEKHEKDNYYLRISKENSDIRSVSYLVSQSEKMAAFMSNLVLKSGQKLELKKQTGSLEYRNFCKDNIYKFEETTEKHKNTN